MSDDELREQSRRFLELFAQGLRKDDARRRRRTPAWDPVRGFLDELSRGAARGRASARPRPRPSSSR